MKRIGKGKGGMLINARGVLNRQVFNLIQWLNYRSNAYLIFGVTNVLHHEVTHKGTFLASCNAQYKYKLLK
jgi:hypothetical protein